MADITSNTFNLPLNAYAAFDASNLKTLMIQRLNDGGVFTDQIYEGSNFNTLLDIIAYSYNVLLFYLNKTASESNYSQAQIYENMNRIVKALNYNPVGNQSAVLSFNAVAPSTLPQGVYSIPRYSYFTANGINYSFTQDTTFIKTSDGEEELTQLNNSTLLYQGTFTPYPPYIANGSPFEEFSLAVNTENSLPEIIDHSNIHVYILDKSGVYTEWKRTDSLYLELAGSKAYECRLNENQRYVLKFGNNVNGKQLEPGNVITVFYLKSDGVGGEIGPGVIDNNSLFLYNAPAFTQVFNDVKQDLAYLTSTQAASLKFINPMASTAFAPLEDVTSIRANAANTFKTQYRLVTTGDFEVFIKNNFGNVVHDIKVVNNWDYLAEHVRYLYNIGLKTPNNDSRVLFNQVTFADSCDFNNIYVYVVPKFLQVENNLLKNQFAGTGLKDLIVDKTQPVKLTTTEVVIMDPVYIAVGIGVASNEEINNSILTPDIISETKLIVGRTPNSVLSENEIKYQVVAAFKSYFNVSNVRLGQNIDLNFITSSILKIPGVTSISTSRVCNGITIQRSGISLLAFNPVYSDPGEDITIINQSLTLPYFKIPYLYNLNTLTNSIDVVTPDVQGASLREY